VHSHATLGDCHLLFPFIDREAMNHPRRTGLSSKNDIPTGSSAYVALLIT
jgi:hypothetical protein